MPVASSNNFREFKRKLLWVICTVLIFLFVWYAWKLLFLAFAGFLLAIILRTFADWFEKYTPLSPRMSYAATICCVVAICGLVAWLIIPNVISQGIQIVQIIPESLKQAKNYLNQFTWGHYVVEFARRSVYDLNIAPKLTHMTTMLMDAAAGAIAVVVVGFYGGMNPEGYVDALLSLVPEADRARAEHVGAAVVYTLRWWLLGQMVPMLVLGIVSMIGLWLLGVPLAFTLGLTTGIMIFVPYLGTLLSEIPAVLVALREGPKTALYVVILYLIIHVLEGYILTPLVQKKAVKLLPILTVLTQLLMWILTGLLGVAIATPLAATGLVLVKTLYLHEEIEH